MEMSNFEFFRKRCQQRWNRRDKSNESFFFICYIFYKDGSFKAVRNNQISLNGINEDDIIYFEGIWEDRYNYKYNDDGPLMDIQNSVPRHTRVHRNSEGVRYSEICQCDSCKSGSLDNGFFYINTNTVRKCQHNDKDVCPCEDIMCPDCVCVTLDGGMEFLRIIGVQGLNTWYESRFELFDEEQKELNLTSDEYDALASEEVKKINDECNAFIVKLEEAIKLDHEQFYAMREAACYICGQRFGSKHLTGTTCRVCGSAQGNLHDRGADSCESRGGWSGIVFPEHSSNCESRGGWSGRVTILHTERPHEDVKQNMSTYRFENRTKDRYESFIYEWRQVIVAFRLKYGVHYEYDV